MTVLAFVTPAAVLGVGLIGLWNRPATQPIYGTLAIIVIGFVARYAVLPTRTFALAVARTSPHFEESAAVEGAWFLRRLVRIVVPLHARAIVAAWLLAFVFCLRDLETTILFYPAGSAPLTVRIITLEANGPEPVVAALALVHASIVAAALVLTASCSAAMGPFVISVSPPSIRLGAYRVDRLPTYAGALAALGRSSSCERVGGDAAHARAS